MRWQRNGHIPDRRPIMSMTPHVVHGILPTSPYGPTLRQIKEHTLRRIQCTQNHKNYAVAAVSRPVLRRIA